ncbi:MAG: ArsR/SmtB family transcription factor [Phycisphaerales bacterium]
MLGRVHEQLGSWTVQLVIDLTVEAGYIPEMAAQTLALDLAFHALSNPTRRSVIERLRQGPMTVKSLAEPYGMALPSFLQHIRVLEAGGLVRSRKQGRVRTVQAIPAQFGSLSAWLERQHDIWNKRLDQLDAHLKTMGTSDQCRPCGEVMTQGI